VVLFPCHLHSAHSHCRPPRYKHKHQRSWPELCSEWEIYRARLRSLECREPALKFSPEVNKQIGIDITQFKGGRYKHFDDLLDGILCAYLAYYFWYWGEDGCWVVGDLETGYVTLPRCRLSNCPLHANAMLASAAPD
jgi:predicted RNase H-like nuclease